MLKNTVRLFDKTVFIGGISEKKLEGPKEKSHNSVTILFIKVVIISCIGGWGECNKDEKGSYEENSIIICLLILE